ncbi:hypothetical protein [Paraburkholderia domus]|jgi:hypothetical protein|uniref:hypothetical protein n=1 Tax=Paraburkholderia domus TaxID=2793075 RepID=UPI001912130B|nr:hypothetical protein [Paraburkholderia domus]MBK5049491.1 hypothetical protein [Burkholderia sp. R-70006]MBK5061946.1 hypothetical protein [Burkholderia sp. R-70199]MBK5087199.1 hypothetical protein [Burkholderia sp. R-69927]MBK5123554.1 hypothetical protein [Burkholderia sp. R-69980]MBK5166786.1 hypothetical protein [Burkholderia sp. R-70211]MBK5180866.1 hypothetical protein [Burkholderia sp. R-69749]MCI0148276.1 hypothetical protein [Paraburkholderia sediminicola]
MSSAILRRLNWFTVHRKNKRRPPVALAFVEFFGLGRRGEDCRGVYLGAKLLRSRPEGVSRATVQAS